MTGYDPALLDQAFALGVAEITEDIASGLVPADVTEFRVLHEYLDANAYGGLFDVDLDGDDLIEFGNELQNRLDAWLKAGRPAPIG